MAAKIETNINTNPTATMPAGIAVGSVTSTALLTTTARTIRVAMSNNGNQDVHIKFQAASVDDDKKSIILHKGSSADVMLAPNVYVGEISAIAVNGSTTLFVMSY